MQNRRTDTTTLHVIETHVNDDQGHYLSDPHHYESHTDSPGELFRSLQREYGKCVSKVYRDTTKGVKAVGWVFCKKRKYSDCDQTFTHTVWVELARSLKETPRSIEVESFYI